MTATDHSADERLSLLTIWAQKHIPGPLERIEPASADASFRRYFRVFFPAGTAIAMDAPPPQESLGPFLDVAARLREAGVAAPDVLASDARRGFALLTDLGATTYLAALAGPAADADRLYGDAIRTLVTMQAGTRTDGLPPYDEALLRREMALFRDWLVVRHLGLTLSAADEAAWRATVDGLVTSALDQPRTFVHRDYHSRNLMVGAPGAPGVLDFQDACVGPLTYDIVSLLKDCYVVWDDARRDRWWRDYLEALRGSALREACSDASRLRADFEAMGVQRHLKASGIFARLWLRDGKPGYLGDIPRTLRYILTAHDADDRWAWLRDVIAVRVLPALDRP